MGLRRQVKQPCPAISRIGPAFDEAARLHLVEQPGERDRHDLDQVGQFALVDAFMPGQIGQHLPLGAGQPRRPRPLFEPLSKQTRDIVQHEADVG